MVRVSFPSAEGRGRQKAAVSEDLAARAGVQVTSWREKIVWTVTGCIHILFWLSLRTHWLAPLFNDSVHRFGPGADFFALYQAGFSALHGESVYKFVPGHTVIPYAYPFRYLPVSAYSVGALLTLVPPAVAYALWLGLCELCLIQNARATYQRSGGGERGAWLCLLWFAFSPYFLELWVGQFTFLLGSLLFWSTLALRDGRMRTAQAWWTASVLWKPASLLWVPIWIRERRAWPGLTACGVLVLANLIYFGFFPGDWAVFVDTNLHPLPSWHAGNVGLSGLIYHFTGEASFVPVRLVLSVILVLPALWVTLRRPLHEGGKGFWLLPALWTCLYFLVYKDVWEHHLTLLLPFLILGLWHSPSRLLVAVAVLLALPSPFVFYDLPSLGFTQDPQPYFRPAVSLLHHSWRVVPVLLVYGLWLWEAGRASRIPRIRRSYA